MKKYEIGQDFESLVREEYKDKIFGKIGGYCLIQIEGDVIIQGSKEIKFSNIAEPLVQYKLATGESLKFMHDEFNVSMGRVYDIVNIPIDYKDEDKDGAFLTYWTFNKKSEAMDMLGFIIDVFDKFLHHVKNGKIAEKKEMIMEKQKQAEVTNGSMFK